MLKLVFAIFIFMFFSCATEPLPDETPNNQLNFPISLSLSKDENFLFVGNTNFDLHYANASINLIDLDKKEIIPESSIFTESFLGEMLLDDNVLITVGREFGNLYFVDLSNIKKPNCGEKICSDEYKLKLYKETPMYLTMDKNNNTLYVGHRNGGAISVVKYKNEEKLKFNMSRSVTIPDFSGDITAVKYNNSKVYVSSSVSNAIYSFTPIYSTSGYLSELIYHDKISVLNENITKVSTQDITFYKDKMLVVTKLPRGLSVLEKNNDSYFFNKFIKTLGEPSKLTCIDELELCIISMYESKSLSVVDMKSELLLKDIELNKRVYDMVYSAKRKELYASIFLENSILVLDMDKDSSSYLKIKEVIVNE